MWSLVDARLQIFDIEIALRFSNCYADDLFHTVEETLWTYLAPTARFVEPFPFLIRLTTANLVSCASFLHCVLFRVDAARPRLGRALRMAPVSRQT
jgi:hypothetical protein